jgi:pSer/pThr/pTyr-binding forkhead associated (FHA) protein
MSLMWILQTPEEVTGEPVTFRILPGGIRTIGRAPQADFVVDVAMVSRIHCRLTAGPRGLEVEDLDSTNGTYVNGRRIRTAALVPGDRLRLGRLELVVSHAP